MDSILLQNLSRDGLLQRQVFSIHQPKPFYSDTWNPSSQRAPASLQPFRLPFCEREPAGGQRDLYAPPLHHSLYQHIENRSNLAFGAKETKREKESKSLDVQLRSFFERGLYNPTKYLKNFLMHEYQVELCVESKLNINGFHRLYNRASDPEISKPAFLIDEGISPVSRWIQASKWYYPVMSTEICWALVHATMLSVPFILYSSEGFEAAVQKVPFYANYSDFNLFKSDKSLLGEENEFTSRMVSSLSLDSSPAASHPSMYGHLASSVSSIQTPEFAGFLFNLLSRMNLSSMVLFLALKYISRLRAAFPQARPSIGCERRLFLTAFILANKCMYDRVYHNHHYEEVTLIPVRDINRMEREFLDIIGYELVVEKDEFVHWMATIDGLVASDIEPKYRPSVLLQLSNRLR